MTFTLSVFNTGQITIPKSIREKKFKNAKKLIAEETPDGLLIKSLNTSRAPQIVVMPYQKETEEGILFPEGIDGAELLNLLEANNE